MSKFSRLGNISLLVVLLCGAGMIGSRAVQGDKNSGDGLNISVYQQTAQKEKTIAELTTELESLKKTLAANNQSSLERDLQLKRLVDLHSAQFNTHTEKFKSVDQRFISHERAFAIQQQRIANHDIRLAAIEAYLRKLGPR